MIDDMSDNGGKIYKYYPCNKYSLNVLKDNQLFFSHPSNFNDPFDSSFDLLVKPYKKFCAAINGIENMTDIFEMLGICCFSKSDKPDNKHFWSLYAGNYTGLALEFNEDELNNEYIPLHLCRVNYFENPMNLDDFDASFGFDYIDDPITVQKCIDEYPYNQMPLDRLFQYLCLYKDKSIWQNEKEYRMIIGNTVKNSSMIQHNGSGYLLNLKPNSIKSITFGYKMRDRKDFIAVAKSKGIPMYEATPDIVTTTTTQLGIAIKPI